jgi:HTH-type transcriptional regulator, competence development regulator
MPFGEELRRLRSGKGIGIKRLAPDLGVSYSYLSKLESNVTRPSKELIERIAAYFDFDPDQLYLSADRVPPDILAILRENPEEATEFLRERFRRGRRSA